jgi:hypothetical protein
VRLFRNTVGVLQDKKGNFISVGLGNGTSDLIGWRSTTITPDMVGQRVAVFVACEVKDPEGRSDPKHLAEQKAFVNTVRDAGGIAGFATSVEMALDLLNQLR